MVNHVCNTSRLLLVGVLATGATQAAAAEDGERGSNWVACGGGSATVLYVAPTQSGWFSGGRPSLQRLDATVDKDGRGHVFWVERRTGLLAAPEERLMHATWLAMRGDIDVPPEITVVGAQQGRSCTLHDYALGSERVCPCVAWWEPWESGAQLSLRVWAPGGRGWGQTVEGPSPPAVWGRVVAAFLSPTTLFCFAHGPRSLGGTPTIPSGAGIMEAVHASESRLLLFQQSGAEPPAWSEARVLLDDSEHLSLLHSPFVFEARGGSIDVFAVRRDPPGGTKQTFCHYQITRNRQERPRVLNEWVVATDAADFTVVPMAAHDQYHVFWTRADSAMAGAADLTWTTTRAPATATKLSKLACVHGDPLPVSFVTEGRNECGVIAWNTADDHVAICGFANGVWTEATVLPIRTTHGFDVLLLSDQSGFMVTSWSGQIVLTNMQLDWSKVGTHPVAPSITRPDGDS